MMRRAASFNAHPTSWKLSEKLEYLIASQLAAQNSIANIVGSVHLKILLCDIQANCANLFHGRSPLSEDQTRPSLAQIDADSGAVHPITFTPPFGTICLRH
jgi:hypothetical protein